MSGPPTAPRRGIVLGGGGVLGAAWMIGALSALRDTCGWQPNDADVLIGTSAGAVLAALLGSGVTVEALANNQRGVVVPGDPQLDFDPDTASGASLPPRPRLGIGSTALLPAAVRTPRRLPPMAVFAGLAPQGRGSLDPVRGLIDAANPGGGWAPHPATWIVAMDYEAGRRVAFGRSGAPAASLADAVVASCAIPGWYAPAVIGGRRYVDGGTCSPTSLDLFAREELDEGVVPAAMGVVDSGGPRA